MDGEFEDFVRVSLPTLGRYACALTGDRHAADDLLQDTLVKVGTAWPRVRRDGNPVAYAKTVMVNTHVSGLRWWARRTRLPEVFIDRATDDVDLGRVEDRDEVFRALDILPPLQRAVLVLGYLDDLDDESIARVVRRRATTVRSLRSRALAAVRSRLDESRQQAISDVREA